MSSSQIANGFEDLIVVPLDWEELWLSPDPGESMIAWPLLPEGRHVTLFGEPKTGKSLLALDLAVKISAGEEFLGHATKQRRVMFIDSEQHPVRDVRKRLVDMGYEPDRLTDLVYLCLPELPKLDTELGAQALLANLRTHGCAVLVIDPLSMTVEGEENSNDTWTRFQEMTGTLLKKHDITVLRVDHPGKGNSSGPRGGSSKAATVDAQWGLRRDRGGNLILEAVGNARMPIAERRVVIRRHDDPFLAHEVINSPAGPAARSSHSKSVDEVIELLHEHGHTSGMTHAELDAFYEEHEIRLSKDKKTAVYQRLRNTVAPRRAPSPRQAELGRHGTLSPWEAEGDGFESGESGGWGFTGLATARRCYRTGPKPLIRPGTWH
jgi:KaiC/GvpD/RAD55 family RecA-like ATPase